MLNQEAREIEAGAILQKYFEIFLNLRLFAIGLGVQMPEKNRKFAANFALTGNGADPARLAGYPANCPRQSDCHRFKGRRGWGGCE